MAQRHILCFAILCLPWSLGFGTGACPAAVQDNARIGAIHKIPALGQPGRQLPLPQKALLDDAALLAHRTPEQNDERLVHLPMNRPHESSIRFQENKG